MRPTFIVSLRRGLALFFASAISVGAIAKEPKAKRSGSIYASWGYNQEWYTRSTIHVKQPGLGNDYQLVKVKAHDHEGWDEGLFQQELTIPQYNYRLGYFFNEKQDLAIEINFDHTKYIIQDDQHVQIKGSRNDLPVNENIHFSRDKGFYYFLNNGANFLLFNLVKRWELYGTRSNNFRVDLLGKAGLGPVIPHVENSFFGNANDPRFQIGGWNAGLETALRVTVMKYAFVEFAQKIDYARYSNLKIYQGTARHNFGTYELILTAGIALPTSRHNVLFTPRKAPAVAVAAD